MKKPWFRWLSVFGFAGYWTLVSASMMYKRKKDYNKWFALLGKAMLLFASFMCLGFIVVLLFDSLSTKSTNIGNISLVIGWIILYFYGVRITDRLYFMIQENTEGETPDNGDKRL